MMRALNLLPFLVLALAACQPSPFATERTDRAEQSYVEPLIRVTDAEGKEMMRPAKADDASQGLYRIQNVRTLTFRTLSEYGNDMKRDVYLLQEKQNFLADDERDVAFGTSNIAVTLYHQSSTSATESERVWSHHFAADRSDLIANTGMPLEIYRLTVFGCCGTHDNYRYLDAMTGRLLGGGDSPLTPVDLMEPSGATIRRYISVESDYAEIEYARPSCRAALVSLADETHILATVALTAPQTIQCAKEASSFKDFGSRKLVHSSAKRDRATVVLPLAEGGQGPRLPFDAKGFLMDKIKLPAGWKAAPARLDWPGEHAAK